MTDPKDITYTERELDEAMELVRKSQHTDDYGSHVWARVAHVLYAALLDRLRELEDD